VNQPVGNAPTPLSPADPFRQDESDFAAAYFFVEAHGLEKSPALTG
jgi:hypothetical protein